MENCKKNYPLCLTLSIDELIIDTKPTVNLLMNIDGYTSRKIHWMSLGRPIVTKGTQQAYINTVDLVKRVKKYK